MQIKKLLQNTDGKGIINMLSGWMVISEVVDLWLQIRDQKAQKPAAKQVAKTHCGFKHQLRVVK